MVTKIYLKKKKKKRESHNKDCSLSLSLSDSTVCPSLWAWKQSEKWEQERYFFFLNKQRGQTLWCFVEQKGNIVGSEEEACTKPIKQKALN